MRERSTGDPGQPGAGELAWIRWRRMALVFVAIAAVATVLYLARGALFPFVISIVLAALLHPVVEFLEDRLPSHERRPGLTRVVAILVIYVVFAGAIAGIGFLTIPPLYHEAEELIQTFPSLYERARDTAESWSRDIAERIPEELRAQAENAIASGGDVIANAAQGVLRRTISGVSNAVTLVIGLAIVPFFLFYILKDREHIVAGVYPMLSPVGRQRTRDVLYILNRVIGLYVRAQFLSATVVGVLVFVGLTVLNVKFAAILGLVAGLFGLIPIIGPVLGAVPGILVALASAPDRIVWVVLVYVVVQIIENNLISPRIHGQAVRLNPAFIMITLVMASEIAGLWGVIIGVPLVAASRDIFVYFFSEWSGPPRIDPQAELPEPDADALEPSQLDQAAEAEPGPPDAP